MGSENVMSIPLPPKYALLERFFNAVESSLYCQKKNSVEFETLRAAVEANVRKTFTEEQFGKLVTIYPEAYDLSRGAKDNAILVSLPPRNYTGDLGAAQHCLNRRRTFKEKLVQLLLVTDKIMPSPMPADTRDSTAADRAMHTKATEGSSGGPGLDLAAVKALKECRRDAPATSKRKFSHGQDAAEDSSVPSAKENKRRNMPAGLKGLPMSLIDSIHTRKEKEQLMDPKVQAERQRARMIETLPAMFDMVYFHFKSIKKHKSEVDKLAQTLAQTEGKS